MIQQYPFFANLLELRREQFERNTAHMNLSKEEKDRRWRIFEQQQAAEMAMAMHAMNGQSNFAPFESTWTTNNVFGLTSSRFAISSLYNGNNINTPVSSTISPNNTIKLPLVPYGMYNFYVDWGDGNVDLIIRWDQPEATHRYSTPGTYNVKILGAIYGWSFNMGGDREKIISIEQWGCLRFLDQPDYPRNTVISQQTGFFCGCGRLDLSNVRDVPYLKNLSSLRNMFKWAWNNTNTAANPPYIGIGNRFPVNRLNEWDVSTIKDFSSMFENQPYFNQDLGQWDVSNATDMSFMFAGSYFPLGANALTNNFFNNGGAQNTSDNPGIGNWKTGNLSLIHI